MVHYWQQARPALQKAEPDVHPFRYAFQEVARCIERCCFRFELLSPASLSPLR